MNKKVKILSLLLGSLLLIYVALDLSVRLLVTKEKFQSFVLPQIEQAIQKKLVIGDFSANLGGITIENTTLFEDLSGTKPLVAFDRISVKVSLKGLLSGDYRIKSILVKNPAFYITRSQDGRFNFESKEAKQEGTQTPLPPFLGALDSMKVENGKVLFTNNDPAFPIQSLTVEPIQLALDGIKADLASEQVEFRKVLISLLNAGEIELSGILQGFSKDASADFSLKTHDLHPAMLLRKIKPELPSQLEDVKANLDYRLMKEGTVVNITGEAKVDNSTNLHYSLKPNVTVDIGKMVANAKLSDVTLKNATFGKEPNLLFLKEVTVTDVSFKDEVQVAKLTIDSPVFALEKDGNGVLNFKEILKDVFPSDDKPAEEPKADAKAPVAIDLLEIRNAQIAYIDPTISSPHFRMNLHEVSLTMKGFGKSRLPSLEFGGKVQNEGKQEAGAFQGIGFHNPLTQETKDFRFTMNDLALNSFSPIAEKLNKITIQSGLATLASITNINERGDLLLIANLEVNKLEYKAPVVLEVPSKLVQSVLEDTGGKLRLENLKVEGNIRKPEFSFASAVNATLANALTNPKVLAIGTAATIGNAILAPPVAIIKGGSALFDMVTGTDAKKTEEQKPSSEKDQKKEGLIDSLGGMFGK